jgi:hypothetical protein
MLCQYCGGHLNPDDLGLSIYCEYCGRIWELTYGGDKNHTDLRNTIQIEKDEEMK